MNKPFFVFSGPVDIFAGYGAKSRDIVLALIKLNKYDIKIIPQRWGNCPPGFLKPNIPDHKLIIDRIIPNNTLDRKPDIWAQCTVPNEVQQIGNYNILFTSGIETTICDPSWIDGCNRADLTITCSDYSKKVFQDSTFQQMDGNGKIIREVFLTKPVEVLFEGINTNIYKFDIPTNGDIKDILDTIEEDFCYLFVGHWLQGDLGQDRKDVGMLVKTFLETFKNRKKSPSLVLKANGADFSILDKEEILEKIEAVKSQVKGILPKIYLIHGELTDEEMNELYNHPKIKAMVSFTKGEGYGRPLLEFTTSQKPVIASYYSGQLDFLREDLNIFLSGKIDNVHQSAVVPNMILPEAKWFTVDYEKASKTLDNVYKNYENFLGNAKKQSYISRTEFSVDKMQEKLDSILEKHVVKQVELKLPELPKLKRV
jgi:glycosyltransferase involved in cell wall biosynthesis